MQTLQRFHLCGRRTPLKRDPVRSDRILFAKYSGSDTKLEGTEYIIIREDDVLGIFDVAAKSTKKAS